MFAFVLHDKRRNLLFGARDRMGIKPLVLCENLHGICICIGTQSLSRGADRGRDLDRSQPISLSYLCGLFRAPHLSMKGVTPAPGHWFRYELTPAGSRRNRIGDPVCAGRGSVRR